MQYGINMMLWSDDVRPERFRPLFERLRSLGYDGVEIPIFDPDPDGYARLGRVLDDVGLRRTASTFRRTEHNPISASAEVRRAGLDQMRGLLESAAALGAPLLVGPTYAALGEFSGRGPTDDEWRRGVESMTTMSEDAGRLGVTLALELLNRFEIYLANTAADMARFVRAVDRPRCRVHYDTFHAHIEERDVTAALSACGDTLGHVHISENDRGTPGRGQVDWARTFEALAAQGYDGWLTVEAFGLALPAMAAATKIWRRTFETEEQLAADALTFMRRSWAAARPGRESTR